MSLSDTIKELKDQIEEEKKKEEDVIDEQEEVEEPADAPAEEEKPEEPKSEEVKEEAKEEEKPDSAAFQRLRREAAAAKKRAEEAEAKLIASQDKPKEREQINEEPSAPEVVPEIAEIVEDHRMKRAEREFQALEANFKANTPEYDAVAAEYAMAIAQSIRIQHPRLSPMDIAEKTKKTILIKAANFMRDGFDPIEELFHEAKDLGFTGKSAQKKEEPEEEVKPDMKKVAANRARSTGMTAASGRSEGLMTKKAAADLTVAEWKRLPKAEKARLLSS